ncbi:MAG: hypothetical protein P1U53_02420 [Sulfitobacter sp.]|nr:hypothetical protein [Sulfitobacter sp.]
MRLLVLLLGLILPGSAFACGAPICLVDPESLALPRVITFDEVRSGAGPGHLFDDVIVMEGAQFGERFAGQQISRAGPHDEVTGQAFSPLTMMPGARGQNLSVVHFGGNSVLNGYGVAGFPKRDGQGEGAIAVLFDHDQSALAFDLRGGEEGLALVSFHARDGVLIGTVPVSPTGEFSVGFLRTGGKADIAGFVMTNRDPQGMAIDTLRFGRIPDLS